MLRLSALLLCAAALHAQLFTLTKDDLIRLTAKNPYGRFDDGRPRVPDEKLEQLKALTVEDVWVVLPGKGFNNQFAGDWRVLHPGKKMAGRVITAQFMPVRPDLSDIIAAEGKKKQYQGGQNQWVLNQIQPGDIVVVDLFGKEEGGTFVGDNLAFYITQMSRNAGLVVDGAIRDLEGISTFEMPVYFRHAHPGAIRDVMLTGFNVPIRIGNTTVMPGDVAFGDKTGIYFIPPQFVDEILAKGADTKIHDDWTKMKFREGKYKSSDIYGSPRDPELKKEYEEYRKSRAGK
ncbi:MAG TPA: dimethylmenaquinone methyltransferase [Bryobacteraceae bacterium]|nr:dimethylmenaquinone methyltransferase [Bryobacteraceae bacterium]